MAEKNFLWKKYHHIIVVIVTLLLILSIFLLNQKINFLLGNELILYLKPPHVIHDIHYGQTIEPRFNVSINNFAFCKATCFYSFNDRSRNHVVEEGNFELYKNKQFSKSYNLSVKKLGSGQDLYSFDVRCHSIKSSLCLTKSPETYRSSLITLNYDLSETEKKLKEILKQNVTKLLKVLNETDVLHQKLNQKYFELAFNVNLNNMSKQKIDIDYDYDNLRIGVENLRSIWSVEDYIALNNLFNQNFFDELSNIKKSIEELDNGIKNVVELHNHLLSQLIFLSHNLGKLNIFLNTFEVNESFDNFTITVAEFNKISSLIQNNTFESYSELIKDIEKVLVYYNLTIEKSIVPAVNFFLKSEYKLNFENELLCRLVGDCEKINHSLITKRMFNSSQEFINTYPDVEPLKHICNSFSELNQKYSDIRNNTLNPILDKNITFPSDNGFFVFIDSLKENMINEINNSYTDAYHELYESYKLNDSNHLVLGIADTIFPSNKSEIKTLQYNQSYNQSLNISLYLLSAINFTYETSTLFEKCLKLVSILKLTDEDTKIGKYNFNQISEDITYKNLRYIDTILSENPMICCIFNECKPCCRDDSCKNDSKTFPVIFLHGHSFSAYNSPEFSLDSFNKLQYKLQDEGYLNAGTISLYSQDEPSQKNVWSLSGKPVTIKVSYYYDVFREEDKYIVVPTKSENIDTYAIRLRDLISIVKERINKPKVNIIAHSMGGLVARRYLQIFSQNNDIDVDKLIMIATPNKGISGTNTNYCGLLGEAKECQDMNENSLFMNRLNDPLKMSRLKDKVKFYTIIGQGCKVKSGTKSGDGDGLLLSNNSELEIAKSYKINGTCGSFFGEILHTDMLNIDKYPETYRVIRDILSE